MDEQTKSEIKGKIDGLRKQRDELVATLHAVDGAIAALGSLLEDAAKKEAQGAAGN